MRRAAAALGGLLAARAEASVCTDNQTGEVFCGDVVRESVDLAVVGPVWVAQDPSVISSYTCSTVAPSGWGFNPGPEHYWSFVCPYDGPVSVQLYGLACDMNLYVLRPCSASACVGSAYSGVVQEEISLTCVTGREYWIVPEAYQLHLNPLSCDAENPGTGWVSRSPYSLSVTCDEICGNDRDDDGDGREDCEEAACAGLPACCDQDGDGVDDPSCGGDDCDDADGLRAPGLAEVVGDGVDQDCDGLDRCYVDADGDGVGGASLGDAPTCAAGWSSVGGDCRDVGAGAAEVWPGAPERVADGVDQDCDGGDACWRDQDGDGWGGGTVLPGGDLTCGDEAGLSDRTGDCADVGAGAAEVYPGAAERLADGVDQDCDGLDRCPVDADGDGWGGASEVDAPDCREAAGLSSVGGDCRDVGPGAEAVYPGAPEVLGDGVDQDCDGGDTCPLDLDGDGWGGGAGVRSVDLVCGDDAGEAAVGGDCVDVGPDAAAIRPGAAELCNGVDDDCDGLVDAADPDAAAAVVWYPDGDGDGWGRAGEGAVGCSVPPGGSARAGDCDDARPAVNPEAVEQCNDLDDDCDGAVDEDGGAGGWFTDADGDGWGDARYPVAASVCAPGDGEAAVGGDCDDADASVAPGSPDVPYDGVDQDCDGADLVDVDGDGAAGGPGGVDCDDTTAAVRPGVVEVADGVDQDCDGRVDEGTEAVDDDGDGFAERGGDCDDGAASVHPAAVEACDGVDEDCDGVVDDGTSCFDDDGDGWSEVDGDCNDADAAVGPGRVDPPWDGVDRDCDGAVDGVDGDGDGVAGWAGDCDDAAAGVHPGAVEVADGVDQDCDGRVDEDTPWSDDDGDGVSEVEGDCHDGDAGIGPGRPEVTPGVDDDCDGRVDEGTSVADDDGDGFSEADGDCDDADPAVSPAGREVEDGVDQDCDGAIDEALEDLDGDGYTVAAGDCEDDEGWVHPDAAEACDGLDNDCDGVVDEEACPVVARDTLGGASGCSCDAAGGGRAWLALLALGWARRRTTAGSPRRRA